VQIHRRLSLTDSAVAVGTRTLSHTHTFHNSVTGIAVNAKGDAILSGYVTNAAGNEDFFAQKVTEVSRNSLFLRILYTRVYTHTRAYACYTVAVLGLNWR
jgi:hypothetical protein